MTLTYSNEKLPEDLSVSKRELQLFIKKLRFNYAEQRKKLKLDPSPIRYFGVGEYGAETHRPHYHLIAFNFPNCFNGRTQFKKCCPPCEMVRRTWGNGHVYLGEVSPDSAAYTAGYVIKGWTRETPIDREPEFTLKSNRPGIGEGFAWEVASELLRVGRASVPRTIRHSGRLWPLGRYMLDKISKYSGGLPIDEAETEDLLPMWDAAYLDESIPARQKNSTFREMVIRSRWDKISATEKKVQRSLKRRSI